MHKTELICSSKTQLRTINHIILFIKQSQIIDVISQFCLKEKLTTKLRYWKNDNKLCIYQSDIVNIFNNQHRIISRIYVNVMIHNEKISLVY